MTSNPEAPAASATDPVCGMTVVPGRARGGSFAWKGREYHFCNPGCREKFAADPEKFLGERPASGLPTHPSAPAPPAPEGAKVEWTCPMHPEIVRDAPGACPICGMALEPKHGHGRRDREPGADAT